jgi:hypothetical protein
MTRSLKLNCLVLGQDRSRVFQVTLNRTKSIADLKEGIKKKKKAVFDHVAADTLVLWKVSVRVDNELERDVESLTLAEEESLSSPIEELGDVFSPERGYVHVVVQPPPLPGE